MHLDKLIDEYPYCQTAEILLALNLFKEDNIRFNNQVRMAAAYAPDRKVLKTLINSLRTTATEPLFSPAETNKIKEKINPVSGQEPNDIEYLVGLLKREVKSILSDAGNSDTKQIPALNDLEESLNKLYPDIKTSVIKHDFIELPSALVEYNLDHLEEIGTKKSSGDLKTDLIDKFIREEPKISPSARASFFDPVDYARKSLEDNDEIVSETLADIYYQQGNLHKAVKVYKKLCLVNPEKYSFFAARINKIQEEIK
jgi:tetratricopeptide (TPR) repeat protein